MFKLIIFVLYSPIHYLMKSIIRILLVIIFLIIVLFFSQTSQNHTVTTEFQEATVDTGIFFMMLFGLLYGARKLYKDEKLKKNS